MHVLFEEIGKLAADSNAISLFFSCSASTLTSNWASLVSIISKLSSATTGFHAHKWPTSLLQTGPLTQLVKRSLQVSNPNNQPVAFKVKTTAPKQYCVRPNSGRIEPGEKVEVQGASSSASELAS